MTITDAALSATEGPREPMAAPWAQFAAEGRTARQSVPPAGTRGPASAPRPSGRRHCEGGCGRAIARRSVSGRCRECRKLVKVACQGYAKCGTMISPRNKTGKCRECWREGLSANAAKTEPEAQAAMLARMIDSFARRCEGEDPGRGLAALLELARRADLAVDRVGMALCEEQGSSAVADDLGWDRRRTDKRWGPAARQAKGW